MSPEAPPLFPAGARVTIHGHGGWPDGTPATILFFPSVVRDNCSTSSHAPEDFIAAGLARKLRGRNGEVFTQFVKFDKPTDDGSGDGTYRATEIPVQHLRADPVCRD